MRKYTLAWSLVFLAFFTNGIRALSAQTPPAQSEELTKNLVRVEKPEPVPEPLAAGFKAIGAKESLALLSFLASDLLEGRETGTRGYELAAEYAASLFGLWNLKPLGDVPPPRFSLAQFLSGEPFSRQPAERTYLQEFAISEQTETSSRMNLEVRSGATVKTRSFQPGQDYTNFSPAQEFLVSAPVVFAGYGISEKDVGYDDFKNLDVRGKVVLIMSGAPGRDNPESPFQRNDTLKNKYFPPPPPGGIIIGEGNAGFNKIAEIRKLRPAAILQVFSRGRDASFLKSQLPSRHVPDEQPVIKKEYHRMGLPGVRDLRDRNPIPLISVTSYMADALLEAAGVTIEELEKKIDGTGQPASMDVSGTRLTIEATVKSHLIRGLNVVGAIEGADPALKDEVVIVGAHLDHVGAWEDYVFNGADDNGSGSVGVFNIARAFFAGGRPPERTIVFCLWCGEEKGLLGSRFFVRNPPFPKARIVAYLNMDMISRPYDERSLKFAGRMLGFPVSPEFLERVNPANFVPIITSKASGLGGIAREADRYVGLDLYVHEAAGPHFGFGTSDHASFDEEKIPWLFPITAVTENLHQTSDSIDKVSGELIEKVSKLMYIIAYQLAQE
jgi:hypothetical protein